MEELSQIEWELGITTRVLRKSEIAGWLNDARIEIESLTQLHITDDANLVEVRKLARQAITK
ncbi:hypothetical protein MKX01_040215, partial [Papaver californicum]